MKKKTFALILTLCMTLTGVVCFAAGAAAAGGLQEISAYLNSNISLKLDGQEKVITDANGVRTYPISYNDTTYLPVRSIAELLGVKVGWDQDTQSVLLGKQPSGVDLIDTYKNYHAVKQAYQIQSIENRTEAISGKTCSNWLVFSERYNNGPSLSFSLDGKYQTLTFSYYADNDATLKITGDNGAVLFEKEVTGGQVAQTVTIPLFNTNELKFETMSWNEVSLYIFGAYLDAEQ